MTEVSSPLAAPPVVNRLRVASPLAPIEMPAQPTINTQQKQRSASGLDPFSPLDENGSYVYDREIKTGYVYKRSSKTKAWRETWLVLRPTTLSFYKSDKEKKLRHKVDLDDLTAVARLKDPKGKREHLFGLFSPSKNFHLEAPSAEEAEAWVRLIRKGARIEEEEEEMLLRSPIFRRKSFLMGPSPGADPRQGMADVDRLASSSPEPSQPLSRSGPRPSVSASERRPSGIESSGLSGAEFASHSDFSEAEGSRVAGASIESLAARPRAGVTGQTQTPLERANTRQAGRTNVEPDPDRVIWHGWLGHLKGGIGGWKKTWAVLRPRNLILYKNKTEESVLLVLYLSEIVSVVETDRIRSRKHCLEIITDEKTKKFCVNNEEELVQCLGAFKSLLARRRELEAKAAAEPSV